MTLPTWCWIGTPFKCFLWFANRAMTWTGLFYFWKRFRSRRDFWIWFTTINMVSMGALGLVFYWLHIVRHDW